MATRDFETTQGISHASVRRSLRLRRKLENAAPDMLAALKDLADECRAYLDGNDDPDMERALCAAENAIAKAEGAA